MNEIENNLDRRLSQLPAEIQPSDDLWPAIRQRIESGAAPSEGGRKRRWLRTAALAASLAVLSSVATSWWVGRTAGPLVVIQSASDNPVFRDAVHAPGYSAAQIPGADYVRDRAAVIDALQAQIKLLPEETQHKIARDLLVIDRALEDISQELTGDPNNVLLQQLLLAMYQEELVLLEDLNQMTEAVKAQRTTL